MQWQILSPHLPKSKSLQFDVTDSIFTLDFYVNTKHIPIDFPGNAANRLSLAALAKSSFPIRFLQFILST